MNRKKGLYLYRKKQIEGKNSKWMFVIPETLKEISGLAQLKAPQTKRCMVGSTKGRGKVLIPNTARLFSFLAYDLQMHFLPNGY